MVNAKRIVYIIFKIKMKQHHQTGFLDKSQTTTRTHCGCLVLLDCGWSAGNQLPIERKTTAYHNTTQVSGVICARWNISIRQYNNLQPIFFQNVIQDLHKVAICGISWLECCLEVNIRLKLQIQIFDLLCAKIPYIDVGPPIWKLQQNVL